MDTICREYIKQTQMLFPIIRKKERIYLKSLYNDLIEYCDINKISNLQELFHEYGLSCSDCSGIFIILK